MPEEKKTYFCSGIMTKNPYAPYCTLSAAENLLKENPNATIGDFQKNVLQKSIDNLRLTEILYVLMSKSDALRGYMDGGLTEQAFFAEADAVRDNPNQAILISALRDPRRYGIPEDLQNDNGVNSVLINVASEHEYNGQTAAEFIAECVQETYAEIATRTQNHEVVSIMDPIEYIYQASSTFAEDYELQSPYDDIEDMHVEPDETMENFSALDTAYDYIGYVSCLQSISSMTDEQAESLIKNTEIDASEVSEDFKTIRWDADTVADIIDDASREITQQDLVDYLPGFYTLEADDITKTLQREALTEETSRQNPMLSDAVSIRCTLDDPNKIVSDDGTEQYMDRKGGEDIPLAKYLSTCRKYAKEAATALSYTYDHETKTLKFSAGNLDYIPENMLYVDSTKFPVKNIVIDESIRAVEQCGIFTSYQQPVETVSFPDISSMDQSAVIGPVQKLIIGGKEYRPTLSQEMRDGISLLACYQLEKQFEENQIPYTQENIETAKDILMTESKLYENIPGINNEVPHAGNSVTSMDYFVAACHEFARSGCPMEEFRSRLYAKSDPIYCELVKKTAQEFSENYHRVPRISDNVAYAIYKGYVSPDFVEKKRFEYKRMKSALAKHTPMIPALAVMGAIDEPNLQAAVLNSPVICQAAQVIQRDIWENTDRNITVDYMKFLLRHPSMNLEIAEIAEAAHRMKEFTINEHTTTNDIRRMKSMQQAIYDLNKIKEEYPDFSLANLKSNLEGPTIEQDGYRAYFLPADDIRQVVIGRDTVCCQHIGGAGETAMMYGLLNPDAGFFVVERLSDHNIVAQGESWLTEDKKTLCFDNIEFADDKDMRSFAPIVAKFAQECPYENVVTGTGYNAFMTSGQIRLEDGIQPPKCAEYDQMVDDELYTDAGRTVGVIKENDIIEPFFANSYEEKEGHPLVSDKAKEVEEVEHDEDVARNPSDENRSSLASLIGAAEAEKQEMPETTEPSRENLER